jgi:hypothetical protein
MSTINDSEEFFKEYDQKLRKAKTAEGDEYKF